MLRAVLLDDEKPALNVLSNVIMERNNVQVVGAYTDPLEMLQNVKELMPDIIFLDIEMPGMNGLELAARLMEYQGDIEIVFVTAYHQHALEAFRVNALDYLLKPVDPKLVHRTIERVLKRRKILVAPEKAARDESRIVCFGGFEIYKAGHAEPIRFPTAKSEELFAYLLVHRNTNISKWTLCDILWPELQSIEKSDHNLHMTVYRMKKTLRESGVDVRLLSQRGFYRLECDDHCDYVIFQQAVQHTAEVEGGNVEALTNAIGLYKGSLFGSRDYSWCEAERERMSRYFVGLSKKLAGSYVARRRYHEAIEAILLLLSYVPFDIEAHEILLKAYIELQDRKAFVSHFEKVEKSFKEELGVEAPKILKRLYINL